MIPVSVCALAMLVMQLLTPFWWWVMIVPFVYGAALAKTGARAARTGFLSAGLLWAGAGLYLFFAGSRIVARRMAGMFGLGDAWTMIAATALVAALAAAVSGYAGFAAGTLFRKKPGQRRKPQ